MVFRNPAARPTDPAPGRFLSSTVRASASLLLAFFPPSAPAAENPAEIEVAWTSEARDTLDPAAEADPDAAAMLADLLWTPESFEIRVTGSTVPRADALVAFPSPRPRGDERVDRVWLEWYRARGRIPPRGAPALIVLHILDGRMRVARSVALACRDQGIHAFVLHLPDYGLRGHAGSHRDVSRFEERFRQGMADARRALDAVSVLPDVDPAAIGIQGTSLGGFVAAVSASLDRAFATVHLMLAGGDLPEMLRIGGKDTAKIRRRLRALGLDDEEIARRVREIDPLRIAHRLDPARTWLYSAAADRVVPPACARALGEAAGLDEEHHVWMPGNHYTCVAFFPATLRDMVEHIRGGG